MAQGQKRPSIDDLENEIEFLRKSSELEDLRRQKDASVLASLRGMVPTAANAPKGEIAPPGNGGAFGPWLAHECLQEAATAIAHDAANALGVRRSLSGSCSCDGNGMPASGPRVLVMTDEDLLRIDVSAQRVRDRLARHAAALDPLPDSLGRQASDLEEHLPSTRPAIDTLTVAPSPGESNPSPTVASETEPAPTEEPAAPAGPVGDLVSLLALARSDFTVADISVSLNGSELVRLTSAALRKRAATLRIVGGRVTISRTSEILRRLRQIAQKRDDAARELARLDGVVARAVAELTRLRAELRRRAAQGAPDPQISALEATVSHLEGASKAATAVADSARSTIKSADDDMTALGTGDAGDSDLVRAVAHEGLLTWDGQSTLPPESRVTHVLVVSLDGSGAESVVRRSILGTSGRLTYNAAVNASWLLMSGEDGTVTGGGSERKAMSLLQDLATGENTCAQIDPQVGPFPKDPLARLEGFLRLTVGVLVGALTLAILLASAGYAWNAFLGGR